MPPLGGKPFQSKLVPFTEEIRAWRRQRKSYAEIARLLTERGMPASPSTIFGFVKARSKRRQVVMMTEAPPSSPPHSTVGAAAIEALKRKPVSAHSQPRFHFDETKPLTLKSE